MTTTIGINGFGRIGRSVLRALVQSGRTDIKVVAINDPAPIESLAHLFQFDSLHGRFSGPVVTAEGTLDVGTGPMRVTHHLAPEALSWADIDIVFECSGRFTKPEDAARHLTTGARRVLLSAPAKGDMKTVCYGTNHTSITAQDQLISNASCTTNCLVPVAQTLHGALGIRRGMMTTVHCYTNTQPLLDSPRDDIYRARAAAMSMVPTSSGATVALGKVLPDLAGRITGQAIRVPAPNVSCIDLVVEVDRPTTAEEVNGLFDRAARGPLKGVLATEDQKLVSADLRQDPHSAIVALDQTRVQDNSLVRVLAWYDNEWGFAHRMLDTSSHWITTT